MSETYPNREADASDDSYEVAQPDYNHFHIPGVNEVAVHGQEHALPNGVHSVVHVGDGETHSTVNGDISIQIEGEQVNPVGVNGEGTRSLVQHGIESTEINTTSAADLHIIEHEADLSDVTIGVEEENFDGLSQECDSGMNISFCDVVNAEGVTNGLPVDNQGGAIQGAEDNVIVISDDDIDDPEMYECPNVNRVADITIVENGGNNYPRLQCGGHTSPSFAVRLGSATESLRMTNISAYTPLQKWEYQMALPVNGVKNVEKWATDVGLQKDTEDESVRGRRRKLNDMYDVQKYGESSARNVLEKTGNEDSPKHDESEDGTDDMEVDTVDDLKGKKKMDDL